MIRLKKTVFLVACLLAALAFAGGCNFVMGPDEPEGGGGNLSVSLGGDASTGSRAITSGADLPPDVLAAMRYDMVLTGPGGAVLRESISGTEILRRTVVAGAWRIDAWAYKEDGLAGTGSLSFTVKPGHNTVWVPMYINEGYFDITPDSSITNGTVTASYKAAFPGTTVTLTVTPEAALWAGTLKYSYGGSDYRPAGSGLIYTFTMPASSVTFTAFPAYTMKAVPGGTVNADIGDSGGPFSTATATAVTVSAFSMGETEITYELWKAVYDWATDSARGANQYTFVNAGTEGNAGTAGAAPTAASQEPVTLISWRDAVVWCNAYSEAAGKTPVYKNGGAVLRESEDSGVSAGSGKAEQAAIDPAADGFRLPTEAEWEYAARGGAPGSGEPWTYTYAGGNNADAVAVHNGNSGSKTAAVKSKAANSLGLYDMSGNVSEWCQDIYTGTDRVLRDGRWDFGASYCTVAIRSSSNPLGRLNDIGFRVVCP